jgi:hypothetical protein
MSEEELKVVSTEPVADAVKPGTGEILHKFWLRPDLRISFKLPEDVTQEEVERLAQAVRTIPYNPNYRKKILKAVNAVERLIENGESVSIQQLNETAVVLQRTLWGILEHVFGAGRVPSQVRQTAERLCNGSILYWQVCEKRSPKDKADKLREIAEAL